MHTALVLMDRANLYSHWPANPPSPILPERLYLPLPPTTDKLALVSYVPSTCHIKTVHLHKAIGMGSRYQQWLISLSCCSSQRRHGANPHRNNWKTYQVPTTCIRKRPSLCAGAEHRHCHCCNRNQPTSNVINYQHHVHDDFFHYYNHHINFHIHF